MIDFLRSVMIASSDNVSIRFSVMFMKLFDYSLADLTLKNIIFHRQLLKKIMNAAVDFVQFRERCTKNLPEHCDIKVSQC